MRPETLGRPRIEGLTTVSKPAPKGWRDTLALTTTVAGIYGASLIGAWLLGSTAGVIAGPVVGAIGYRKQFWKTALVRKESLRAVPAPERPAGLSLNGTAEPFERTLDMPRSVVRAPLVVATAIHGPRGVFVRAIESVPFWLVLAERRVLVTGACWANASLCELLPVNETLHDLGADRVPLSRWRRRRLTTSRVTIAAGDRVCVTGQLRQELLAGMDGYRDSFTEVVRGEPGAIAWIDRQGDPATANRNPAVIPSRAL